ncbi:protein mono-ADP-ribosyltransferase TIPARP [Centroberyx gerrardi]|uniref:protein mono-ADP-ribosyltransferase TIPARP n=1 Tax=Centroberyx gerrardi TaxID=166262 RepID=UPI003AAB5428
MDKTLRILQKPTDGVPAGISLDMSLNVDEREDFTEQQIVGLPDKIPLVKPYFKKKQRKLDAKCLHRALEDPILTTLLSTDALVSGDGVFVPRSQPGRTPGNLCAAAVVKQSCIGQVCLKDPGAADDAAAGTGVAGLLTRDGDAEMADTTAELEETERRGERPKLPGLDLQRAGVDPTSDSRCFQLKPGLRAAGATVTITPPARDIPPIVAPQPPHQEGAVKTSDLFTSGAKCLPVKDSSSRAGPPHPLLLQAPQLDKGVIFQDKSEEASLDLVFELLTQLQYHTHQADSVSICVDFLQGQCVYGSDCAHHHTVLPYHWQIRRSSSQTWQSIADDSQEQLERLYCNPDNEQVRLKFQGRVFSLDFGAMRVCDLEFDRVRRLTTPPSPLGPPPTNPNPIPNCHTVWKYYCRDNFGWREYSEPVVRLIEEASGRGLKEVRFITLQNQYILNIREGFQQNAVFGFRRQIKKRPMFMSSVVLTPLLQTLSGLSSSPLPSSSSSSCSSSSSSMDLSVSLPLSPTSTNPPSLFPETWLPMTTSQDFLQVPVSRDDRSYRTVYSLFHKTVSETKFRILKILRVQNPFLWEKYKRKKEYMSRRLSEMDRLLSERHLFHGTSADVVEGICKHNFDPRVCGKHATMFGQGSYFARKAVYSHNFSKRSPKGVHCMFLAKVLTGRFTVGNPSMRRPPPISPRDPSSDLYDSCVDNWVDPQIYVIFNDDQSYPYFIIQYEEVPSTVAI